MHVSLMVNKELSHISYNFFLFKKKLQCIVQLLFTSPVGLLNRAIVNETVGVLS